MQKVSIFIVVSSHAPKTKRAWYKYIMVCGKKCIEKKVEVRDLTGHQLVMECTIAAMKRMVSPAVITIFTDSHYLANGHGKMMTWKKNGWKRENGQELKNVGQWQQLETLLQPHAVRFRVESMLPYT